MTSVEFVTSIAVKDQNLLNVRIAVLLLFIRLIPGTAVSVKNPICDIFRNNLSTCLVYVHIHYDSSVFILWFTGETYSDCMRYCDNIRGYTIPEFGRCRDDCAIKHAKRETKFIL